MPRADDLRFQIGANVAGFVAGMNQSRRTARTAGADVSRAFHGAERGFIAATRGATALASALGLVGAGLSLASARQAIGEVAKIGDIAGRVAMTTDEVQEFRYALEQTGGTAEQADIGLQRFSRRIAEIAAGADNDLAKVLKANNIELLNQEGNLRRQSDILRDYAELIRNAGNEQDRTRLAFLAFDSEGVALVNTLKEGADGLDRMRHRAHELGIVLSVDTVRAAKEMDDKFNEVLRRLDSGWKEFVVSVAEGAARMKTELAGVGTAIGAAGARGRELAELSVAASELEKRIAEMEAVAAGRASHTTGSYLSTVVSNLFGSGDALEDARTRLAEIRAELFAKASAESMAGLPKPDKAAGTVIPNKEDEKARAATAKAAEKQAQKVKEVTEALIREWQALGQNNEQKRIANELAKAGVAATSEEGQAIADIVRAIEAEQRAMDGLNARMQDFTARQNAARDSAQWLGDTAESSLIGIIEGTVKAEDALKSLATQFAIAAAKAVFLGQGPLAGLFGPATLPGGSISPQAATMAAAGIGGLHAATGGYVSGPGSATSDSVDARLSNGEFVVNAFATRRHRATLEAINQGRPMQDQAGHVTVGVRVDDEGALQAYVARTTGAVVAESNRRMAPQMVKAAVNATARRHGLSTPSTQT